MLSSTRGHDGPTLDACTALAAVRLRSPLLAGKGALVATPHAARQNQGIGSCTERERATDTHTHTHTFVSARTTVEHAHTFGLISPQAQHALPAPELTVSAPSSTDASAPKMFAAIERPPSCSELLFFVFSESRQLQSFSMGFSQRLALSAAALSVALNCNTLQHGFVMDDTVRVPVSKLPKPSH